MPEMKCDKCGGELQHLQGHDFHCPKCTPIGLPVHTIPQEEPKCPACEAGIPTREVHVKELTPELALKNELIERQESTNGVLDMINKRSPANYVNVEVLENQRTIMKALRYLLARDSLERKGEAMKRFRIVLKRIETIETIIEIEVDEPRPGCALDHTAKVNVLEMAQAGKLELNFNKDNSVVTYDLGTCEEIEV